MSQGLILNLADCSEFRQTVASRPPRIVHGTAFVMVGLLAAALTWAALVEANLVVRAAGRVRPVEITTRVFASANADLTGRVLEAPFDEGDVVRKGDLLVRLDTAQIDIRIAKLEQALAATKDEIAKLLGLEGLLDNQLASAKAKADAELIQAEKALARAVDQRASAVRSAEAALKAAADFFRRRQQLRLSGAVTEEDFVKSEAAVREAEERLVEAQLPVDAQQVAVARRAAELIDRDFAVRRAELEARRVTKQGEAEAHRRDLASLELQKAEAVLLAPIDGVVVAGRVQPGDVLEPGKPVLEIAPQDGFRFEALVLSEDVGNIREGMPVRIKFDAYDYQKYGVMAGTVTYLSPDSKVSEAGEGEQSTPDRSARRAAAFVVRVEMASDELRRGELRAPVKLGLGGAAEIVTDRESVLMIFLKKIRQTISLG